MKSKVLALGGGRGGGMDLTRKALEALVQLFNLCGVDIADISHQIGDLVIFD